MVTLQACHPLSAFALPVVCAQTRAFFNRIHLHSRVEYIFSALLFLLSQNLALAWFRPSQVALARLTVGKVEVTRLAEIALKKENFYLIKLESDPTNMNYIKCSSDVPPIFRAEQ